MKSLQPGMPALSDAEEHAPVSIQSKSPSGAPVVDCATLLRGHRQVMITHDDCVYVLRLTRGNKLILTK